MNKNEWQTHYGLNDEEMQKLEEIIKMSGGKIVRIVDNPDRKLL